MPDAIFLPLAFSMLWLAYLLKPGRIVVVLVCGLIASLGMRFCGLDDKQTLEAAFAIDAIVIASVSDLWIEHPNKRAWALSIIGACKLVATAVAYTFTRDGNFTHSDWHHYAWFIGLAYLLQVSIAGGFTDVIGRRMDHYIRRHFPRRYQHYWHEE